MNTVTLRPHGRLSFGFARKEYKTPYVPKLSKERKMFLDSVRVLSQEGVDRFPDLGSEMGSSNLSNSEKIPDANRRAKRGSRGMTTHGQLLVKDAAYWLQREYGKERLSFWTLTIPPECHNASMVQAWSEAVRLVVKKLVYHLEKNGLPKYVVGVTEIQPRRSERGCALPPLHLHIVFVGSKTKYVPLLGTKILDKIWVDVLENFSHIPTKGEACSSIQYVRKSVSGYLGKYMSKGSDEDLERYGDTLPSSWYFCTKDLRDIVRALIVKASGEWVNEIFLEYEWNDTDTRFYRQVRKLAEDGTEMYIGWYGELKGENEYLECYQAIKYGMKVWRDELVNNSGTDWEVI